MHDDGDPDLGQQLPGLPVPAARLTHRYRQAAHQGPGRIFLIYDSNKNQYRNFDTKSGGVSTVLLVIGQFFYHYFDDQSIGENIFRF